MARGKQAAQSANRRYEASIDHIDRLTNELMDAKARARRYETAAQKLPAVESELSRLRNLCAEQSSDELEAQRERNRVLREKHEGVLRELGHLIRDVSDRLDSYDVGLFSHDEMATLDRLLGMRWTEGSSMSRGLRRTSLKTGDTSVIGKIMKDSGVQTAGNLVVTASVVQHEEAQMERLREVAS